MGSWFGRGATMQAVNSTSNQQLASNLVVADNFPRRMIGLLGRKSLVSDEGLWIKPCMGVHTFGMRFPIDVVFLTRERCVLNVRKDVLPNRLSPVYLSAESILELPAGKVEATATKVGDYIKIF